MKNVLQPLACIPCIRQRGDLIETYEIINKVNNTKSWVQLKQQYRTRGDPYKLVKQRNRLDL